MSQTVTIAPGPFAVESARAPASRAGRQTREIRLDSPLESDSCGGRVPRLGEHLLCKKAGEITQVPLLVSLTRNHAVQPTS